MTLSEYTRAIHHAGSWPHQWLRFISGVLMIMHLVLAVVVCVCIVLALVTASNVAALWFVLALLGGVSSATAVRHAIAFNDADRIAGEIA